MEGSIANFNSFLVKNYVDPSHECSISSIDQLLEDFQNNPLWLSRARVVQLSMDSSALTSEIKEEILNFYASYAKDVPSYIEAARAAAVLEEPEALIGHLEKAQDLLQFSPEVVGVEVMFTPHQESPRTRVGCLAKPDTFASPPDANERAIEVVKLNSNDGLFEPPKFVSAEQENLSTGLLSDVKYLILLLHASYTCLSNPASTTTVVNEQALPFVRRVTETKGLEKIDFAVQQRALFDRSVLELKDINELERGTVQLMKISKATHAGGVQDEARALQYFHQLVPLSWKTVDELTARRLVAMSDFANAIPYYKNLNQPLDIAVCLTATGATEEALKVLESPELANNGKALLLRGDLSTDPSMWQKVWDSHNEPRAKFRLAQKAVADNSLEEAMKHLEDMLAVQPADYEALKLASATALSLQRWEPATTYLRRCLAINDDDVRGWSNLATALLQTDQAQAAHHALKQALRVNQNSEPDLPTSTNFVALSAQLELYNDVLVGLNQLADSSERGSQPYVAKVSGFLPRLVAFYLKGEYTGATSQSQLLTLFTEKLPKVISGDDAMLCRLTGQVQLWARRYQEGLASLNKATDILFSEATSGTSLDARSKARLHLYSKDLLESLEKYGDKEGRIEGSKAFPGWQARKQVIERKLQSI